jgi:hypothetical protein
MKKALKSIVSIALITLVASCGGGSSSSENSEANVSTVCMVRSTLSGTGVANFVNGCDFLVNFRSNSRFGSEPTIKNNIAKGQSITLEVSLSFASSFVLCKAPAMPNESASNCI